MKKIFALICVIAVMLVFTSCGKFTCDMCGEEKMGTKYTTQIGDQAITICEECKEDPLRALGGLFN